MKMIWIEKPEIIQPITDKRREELIKKALKMITEKHYILNATKN